MRRPLWLPKIESARCMSADCDNDLHPLQPLLLNQSGRYWDYFGPGLPREIVQLLTQARQSQESAKFREQFFHNERIDNFNRDVLTLVTIQISGKPWRSSSNAIDGVLAGNSRAGATDEFGFPKGTALLTRLGPLVRSSKSVFDQSVPNFTNCHW